MLEFVGKINSYVNGFIWGVPAMICIVGVGLYLTIRTRFIQVRKFGTAMKQTIGKIFERKKLRMVQLLLFRRFVLLLRVRWVLEILQGLLAPLL